MQVISYWLLVISLFGNAIAAETKSTTIGILPFECQSSGEEYRWLSAGISDTLIAKFTGNKGIRVVERERLASLTNVKFSMLNDELSPSYRKSNTENRKQVAKQLSLLNAQYLLVGSYTILGEQIKINARIVHAETAKINGATALTVRGKVADIFALETELAEKFAKACNLEVAYNKLSYTDGRNTASYELFNRGKMFFADGNYAGAIDAFIKSQQQNDGFYFAEAHTWEGKARIALANVTNDKTQKDKIQKDHVKKFEKDAAEAAPAFYDLGVALQACGQYEKAIKAYDDYLRWMSMDSKTIRNECTSDLFKYGAKDFGVEYCHYIPRTDMKKSLIVNRTKGRNPVIWNNKMMIIVKDIFSLINPATFDKLWSVKLAGFDRQYESLVFTNYKKSLVMATNNSLYQVSAESGRIIKRAEIPDLPSGLHRASKSIFISPLSTKGIIITQTSDESYHFRMLKDCVCEIYQFDLSKPDLGISILATVKNAIPTSFIQIENTVTLLHNLAAYEGSRSAPSYEVNIDTGVIKKLDADKRIHVDFEEPDQYSKHTRFLSYGFLFSENYFTYSHWKKGGVPLVTVYSKHRGKRVLELGQNPMNRNVVEPVVENSGALYGIDRGVLKKWLTPEMKLVLQYPLLHTMGLVGVCEQGIIIVDRKKRAFYCFNEDAVNNLGNYESLAFFYKGQCYQKLKNYKKAIMEYGRAEVLNPSLKELHYLKGKCYSSIDYSERNKRNALESYSEYLKYDNTVMEQSEDSWDFLNSYGLLKNLFIFTNDTEQGITLSCDFPKGTLINKPFVSANRASKVMNRYNSRDEEYLYVADMNRREVSVYDSKDQLVVKRNLSVIELSSVSSINNKEKRTHRIRTSFTVGIDKGPKWALFDKCSYYGIYETPDSNKNFIYKQDLKSGRVIWNAELHSVRIKGNSSENPRVNMYMKGEMLLVVNHFLKPTPRISLSMYNSMTGKPLWQKHDKGKFTYGDSLIIAGGYLFYSQDKSNRISVLELGSGKMKSFTLDHWRSNYISFGEVISDKFILASTNEGRALSIDIETLEVSTYKGYCSIGPILAGERYCYMWSGSSLIAFDKNTSAIVCGYSPSKVVFDNTSPFLDGGRVWFKGKNYANKNGNDSFALYTFEGIDDVIQWCRRYYYQGGKEDIPVHLGSFK